MPGPVQEDDRPKPSFVPADARCTQEGAKLAEDKPDMQCCLMKSHCSTALGSCLTRSQESFEVCREGDFYDQLMMICSTRKEKCTIMIGEASVFL